MQKKLYFIVNDDWFFLSHRLPIALAAKQAGFDVTIIARDSGKGVVCESYGFHYIDLPINPTGMNPCQELKTLSWLICLFKKERPDIVHLVGLKCMLWGGLAARLMRVPQVVNAVSGLGVMFSGSRLSLVARVMMVIQRFSSKRDGVFYIFQNSEDRQLFISQKVAKPENCRFTKGSGIDLDEFAYVPQSAEGKVHVIFTARMLKEKGVLDLISAARQLEKEYKDKADFWLCGGLSPNPKALQETELKSLCDGQYIQWLGLRNDIKELLGKSHIVAFPSYYREGLPKSLIEASAVGRPIITCNSVGCKDVVVDGENGFLIPPKDVEALVSRLRQLIDNPVLRERMGLKSREYAQRDFDIQSVIDVHLSIYTLSNPS